MKNFFKRFVAWLLQGLLSAALLIFFVVMFAEWASGCGESYVDAKGKTHVGQCIFLDGGNK
jgi:hypothetical protein